MKISAILLAAGSGERLKRSVPKAFVEVQGQAMFRYSLNLLDCYSQISEIILVIPKSETVRAKKLASGCKKVRKIVVGGATRQASLAAGLKFCREQVVLSQNSANPFATAKEITGLVQALKKFDAAAVAHRADSTVRQNSKTLDRRKIWLMETPQIAKKEFLERGLKIANSQKIEATDELQLAELAGAKIKIISADKKNRKITHPGDLEKFPISNFQFPNNFQIPNSKDVEYRIGFGHDSHRFSNLKKPLFLGSYRISVGGGLEGNSDGDVLLHALTNAVSSALGGGSLSTFADAMCRRGIRDSKKYLQVILKKMRLANFEIGNLALSIEGKKPKLEKHFPKIKKNLAKLLRIEPSRIGLTATTGEGLTAFGRGEGLQVFAIVLLSANPSG